MTRAAASLLVYGLYIGGSGLTMLLAPGLLAHLANLPAETEPAIRFAGILAFALGYYDLRAAREGSSDRLLARIVLSAFLATGVMVFSLSLYGRYLGGGDVEPGSAEFALQGIFRLGALALSAPVLLLLGLPLADAVIAMRRFLSADALVVAGVGAAWLVSLWNTLVSGTGEVYFETATLVLLLFTLGRWLDTRAKERARDELGRLVPRAMPQASRVEHGAEVDTAQTELAVGDVVRVRPGEPIPVDGVVIAGRSFVDLSSLTGEEQPRALGPGDRALAGSSLVDGSLDVRAEAVTGDRLRDEVEHLLERAMDARAPQVRLADRLAGALLPPLARHCRPDRGPALALQRRGGRAVVGARRALDLVPLRLGIATPLAFWTAIGAAWKRGILIHGGDVLERLAGVRRVLLDKTGTLTTGEFELRSVRGSADMDGDAVLRVAAALPGHAEGGSEVGPGGCAAGLQAHDLEPVGHGGGGLTAPGQQIGKRGPGLGVFGRQLHGPLEGGARFRRPAERDQGEPEAGLGEAVVGIAGQDLPEEADGGFEAPGPQILVARGQQLAQLDLGLGVGETRAVGDGPGRGRSQVAKRLQLGESLRVADRRRGCHRERLGGPQLTPQLELFRPALAEEVLALVGVARQVVELGERRGDQLPALVPHCGERRPAVGVPGLEGLDVGRGNRRVLAAQERRQTHSVAAGECRQVQQVKQGRRQVHQAGTEVAAARRKTLRPVQHQRHEHGVVVDEEAMGALAVLAQRLAMIAGDHSEHLTTGARRGQQAAELVVDRGHLAVVGTAAPR